MIRTVNRGESVTSLARLYLPQSIFMTRAELEVAIRAANSSVTGNFLQPGQQIVIPGVPSTPRVERPIPVPSDFEVRGIYLTAYTAGSEKGIELVRHWREAAGNAVVFDIKDFDGLVHVPFDHALASGSEGQITIHNLPKYVHFLHSLGMHAIARITLFRDAYQAQHHPGLAVHSRRTGQPWRENGKLAWVDPSNPEVQNYNLALAKHVAGLGVDEIQFDYVRFPAEGDQKDAKFFFQAEHPEWPRSKIIADFVARAYDELHPLGVLVSLDVFGVMAWQRDIDLEHTGQDIAAMVQHCDVLSPMIYPSHFFGMEGFKLPGDAPEHFISESMQRFQEITEDSDVVLRPWLQAFGWRTKTYSPAYILTQVSVAKEEGGVGFLFWNARNDYSKPFVAMSEMRAAPGKFFRGDELPTLAAGAMPASPGLNPLPATSNISPLPKAPEARRGLARLP